MTGFYTLFYKEWLRFWKVSVQTVLAPVLMALLFLLVFSHTLHSRVEPFPGVSYTAFLVPGLAMMSVLQNAFANSSSSLMQSKITGNIVFVLLPPLSHREFFLAYLLAAVARGLVVGLGVFPLRIFRARRRFARFQPGDCRRVFFRLIMGDDMAAQERLQAQAVTRKA